MRYFWRMWSVLLVLTGIFAGITQVQGAAPPDPEKIATEKIQDMRATLTVRKTNRSELKKMGGAFATTYSVREMDVTYKYPNKARFEGKILGATVMMVYNGDMKIFKTPITGTQKKDVSGQPGQKQTLMDLGIFAKDYILTDYKPVYQRTEKGLHVFKMVQRNTDNSSHEIVWVNPKTAIIEKRMSYNGDNVLQKELRYVKPRQVRPGIWVPTQIEVYNQEGKLGLVQSVDNVKINLGVNETAFEI
ncbi:MAG: hypothetical protein OHK0029_07540 [Armatimonadaceae bacterium]